MFLPTTKKEQINMGWDSLDVILVSGDSYIDSPYSGIAIIGNVLAHAGYRVGVIAQPDITSGDEITRLGEPKLFWGISGGSVDSMVANYTAVKKKRHSDDFTPGGDNNRRPDRAVIAYSNLIRKYFKNTKPLVLGGIEASLRRVSHYDYWQNTIRRSILFDAKADILVYGMGEKTILELAQNLREGRDFRKQRGICYISKEPIEGYLELPSHEQVLKAKLAFIDMFHTFYQNNDPVNAVGLVQLQDTRYLVQNPPQVTLTQQELDGIYDLPFENAQHPFYEKMGKVNALETIRFSIPTHRGCYGECNFCAIAVHEGRTVSWRSRRSIIQEAEKIAAFPDFKGYIQDVSGPTANMYGYECDLKLRKGSCKHKRCIYPEICSNLPINHKDLIVLLENLRKVHGVKKVFVGSGIRYDMVMADKNSGKQFIHELAENHVSGQLKVAPEHSVPSVLQKMGKPGVRSLLEFKEIFDRESEMAGKKQFLTYYLIAAHPGCSETDMLTLRNFMSQKLKIHPEQVQIFTPTPSTYSSLMYYTEIDPFTGNELFVVKDQKGVERQKQIVTDKNFPASRR